MHAQRVTHGALTPVDSRPHVRGASGEHAKHFNHVNRRSLLMIIELGTVTEETREIEQGMSLDTNHAFDG